jgi:hypothetical protein
MTIVFEGLGLIGLHQGFCQTFAAKNRFLCFGLFTFGPYIFKIMYTGFLHLHSLLRWVLLVLLLVMIYRAFMARKSGRAFDATDRKLSLFTMISAHIQLVLGFVMYFMNDTIGAALSDMGATMKDGLLRFLAVEHALTMVMGIVLITIGHIKAKKAPTDHQKFGAILMFYLLGLILIISRIPWPFMEVGQGRGWF